MTDALATLLRSRMRGLGINQRQASEICGVSTSVFSYWMSGRLPSFASLDGVAEFLNIPREELLAVYPPTYKVHGSRSKVHELAALRADVARLEARVKKLESRDAKRPPTA